MLVGLNAEDFTNDGKKFLSVIKVTIAADNTDTHVGFFVPHMKPFFGASNQISVLSNRDGTACYMYGNREDYTTT